MNLFNSFQAMAFYTMTPLGIQWLFKNDYVVAGFLLSTALLIGYAVLSITIHEEANK